MAQNTQQTTFTQGLAANFVIKRIAKKVAKKLNAEIERGNDFEAFMLALLLLAIPKDLFDGFYTGFMTLLQGMPMFGQAVAFVGAPGKWVIGSLISATLYYFMLHKGWFIKYKIRLFYFLLGFVVDNLPGVDILPMATLSLLYAWKNVRHRARQAKEKLAVIETLSMQELEAIGADISIIDNPVGGAGTTKNPATRSRDPRPRGDDGETGPENNSEPSPVRQRAVKSADLDTKQTEQKRFSETRDRNRQTMQDPRPSPPPVTSSRPTPSRPAPPADIGAQPVFRQQSNK